VEKNKFFGVVFTTSVSVDLVSFVVYLDGNIIDKKVMVEFKARVFEDSGFKIIDGRFRLSSKAEKVDDS